MELNNSTIVIQLIETDQIRSGKQEVEFVLRHLFAMHSTNE